MIETTKAYKTEDGQTFTELKEAQRHALLVICESGEAGTGVIDAILSNAPAVIKILKLKPRKERTPKAAKAKAAKVKKPAKLKTVAEPAPAAA